MHLGQSLPYWAAAPSGFTRRLCSSRFPEPGVIQLVIVLIVIVSELFVLLGLVRSYIVKKRVAAVMATGLAMMTGTDAQQSGREWNPGCGENYGDCGDDR